MSRHSLLGNATVKYYSDCEIAHFYVLVGCPHVKNVVRSGPLTEQTDQTDDLV